MATLSVIIPTYKRAKILEQCLEHLQLQTVVDQLEAIVVSDGPDNEVVSVCSKEWKMPVECYAVPKSQQGVARNKGVTNANTDLCLFIGDDILLTPDACEKHIAAHGDTIKKAVLGFVTWDNTVGITTVMEWLEQSGWQFGYPQIAKYKHAVVPKEVQHQFTYTSNISLPTELAKTFPFREDITLYGWEDIEWGMRLRNAGIPLYYEPEAFAHHHHRIKLEESLKRMETLGESAVILKKEVPELDRVPIGLKYLYYQITSLLPTMMGKHRKAFLRGMKRANK